ncbi:MAG: hypothetical protein IKO30_11005 [Lachnospiraceae bacterium]|nr:hypothetical protein [Lachnospiraceae bacterium]
MLNEIYELNDKLKKFAVEMRTYLEDILRVEYAFTEFLERIHSRNRFLTNKEIADTLAEFEDEKKLRMYACGYLRTSGSIQLTYNRTYKQHYARLLKKKMTQAEFQAWADYAIKLRDMVEHKKIDFDEYYKKIRE